MSAKVVTLADFRNPVPDVPVLDEQIGEDDKAMFAVDTVADKWANDLVHGLMMNFAEGGQDINFDDPVYGKLMEGVADVVRSMTRHHLDVLDETALLLQKYPEANISVGVITMDEE